MPEQFGIVEGLLLRLHGPLSMRLVIQPLISIFFAVRDGKRDARAGAPAFFWALFSDSAHRRELLQNGWKSIGKVFLLAIILDAVFQYLTLGEVRPLGAIFAGLVLALVPYVLLRGPANRLFKRPPRPNAS